MTQQRGTATKQLSTVITALQVGQKTGILTVERGEGKTFEGGTIIFVHGQVAQAAIGSYTGRDAATKLFSWQACRFSFAPLLPEDSALAAHLVPHPQTGAKTVTQNGHKPSSGNHQTNSTAEGDMSRRPLMAVPQQSMDDVLRILDRQGFSRTHRRLLLLIDGRRSISELAALIGRTQNETATLLTDLWRAGLTRL
jgi:hypothetical protein